MGRRLRHLSAAAATSDDVETLERVLDSASEGVARRRILRAHHSSPEMMSLTALGAAAEVGHFRAADFLLRQGAPINAPCFVYMRLYIIYL